MRFSMLYISSMDHGLRITQSWSHSLQLQDVARADTACSQALMTLRTLLICECTYRWRSCWSVSVRTLGDLVGL